MKAKVVVLLLFLMSSFLTSGYAQISETLVDGIYLAEPGEYIVGEDLPAGIYDIELNDYKSIAGVLINNPGEYGTTVCTDWFGEYTDIYKCTDIEIEDGQLIYIYTNEIIFIRKEA